MFRRFVLLLSIGALSAAIVAGGDSTVPLVPKKKIQLFNGKDFTGWKVPAGDNGHWKVLKDGVIDYDAKSEAKGDKSLWTEKSYKDFVLMVDWRLKTDKGFMNKVPIILPDGNHKLDKDG